MSTNRCRECPTAAGMPAVKARLTRVEKRLDELLVATRELHELHRRHAAKMGSELARIVGILGGADETAEKALP